MKSNSSLKIVAATVVIVGVIAWLAISGVSANKSYYVTISELHAMGDKSYVRNLRVAGFVKPGSITQDGTDADFTLLEENKELRVKYVGAEPPPDTFKDNAQALAVGRYGRDGVFHATELQAKCASKYTVAPGTPGAPATPGMAPKPAAAPAPNKS
jgi:cytochrome c-type biogenesis protein CcmE